MKNYLKNIPHREYVMTVGAITGGIMSIITIFMYASGNMFSPITDYLNAFIMLIAIIAGIQFHYSFNSKKKYSNNLQTGASIAFWASIILGFTYFILVNYVDKNLFHEYLVFFESELNKSAITINNKKELVEELRNSGSPNILAFQKFIGKSILGIFFSSIFALRLGSKSPNKTN